MNQKTQILYIITKGNMGGAQKYVLQLALEAKERGWQPSVAVGEGHLLKDKLREKDIPVFNIKNLQRDVNFVSDIKSFFEIIKVIKKTRPTTVHLNSSKIGAIGAMAARMCGVKNIIFTAHGWAFNEERSFLSKLFIKISYLATIVLSHKIIMVSQHTKEQGAIIPFFNFFDKKILVIKNGVEDINFFEKEESRSFFQDKFKISQDKKIIGTLAELHPIKGLKYLIEAAELFFQKSNNQDYVFLILGDGQEKTQLEKIISKKSLESKVILGGFLNDASLYLKGFDFFVLSSLSEAMPLSILEAGQAGLPIISTKVGGVSEIITDNENGILINPADSYELETALNKLTSNPNLSTKIANSIKEKIATEFNISLFYQKTFSLYK